MKTISPINSKGPFLPRVLGYIRESKLLGLRLQLAIFPTRVKSIATSFSAFQIKKIGFFKPHCT